MEYTRKIYTFSILFLLAVITGCSPYQSFDCGLTCGINLAQSETITVDTLLTALQGDEWLLEDVGFMTEYSRDTFSNVLETRTTIELNRGYPHYYEGEVTIYHGNIGTVELDLDAVGQEVIEAVSFPTNLTVFDSLRLFGLPDGGQIIPFEVEADFAETNPCPDSSHYIAYYDNANIIVRAVVSQYYRENLLTSPVEIVYLSQERAEFGANVWIGNYERMDHNPCF